MEGPPANVAPEGIVTEEEDTSDEAGELTLSDEDDEADAPDLNLEETPLLDLETAVARVPANLRQLMEDQLRAQFREVRRWKR